MQNFDFDDNFLQIIDNLKKCDNVDCIALGGSRATGNNDSRSDYDIYVYCKKILSEDERSKALLPLCSVAEICNHYWESEDNCIMNNGVAVDIIYRELGIMERYLCAIVDEGHSFNGYTTAFWHNIVTSKILFDKSGEFTKVQKKYTVDYPQTLKKNIIEKNRKLLSGTLPSYDKQIKKAADRGDIVSVNHRITEFLSSYFDIIFALNELTHPGEKRLVELCKRNCKLLPNDFEENINLLFASITNGKAYDVAKKMIEELDLILMNI
ncbi:MAG: DUF4037 domain-containing protein [Ruminococcus sp.]|nr:DUF4037 domain-containing protein [Ruminococcus sp.]